VDWQALSPFGAQVDLDLTGDVSPAMVAALVDLFDRRHMLVFSNQDLSSDDQARMATWFGPVEERAASYISTEPEIGGLGHGRLSLHSDQTASPEPFMAISLYAADVVPGTTSTVFVDAVRAAASLPATLRERIKGLDSLHVLPTSVAERQRIVSVPSDRPSAVHPVLMPHPRTGAPILFVNTRTDRIVGLPPDEGEALLQALFDHLYDNANMHEHPWSNGDLVMWDNLALQHGRPPVPAGITRTLRKVVVGTQKYVDMVPRQLTAGYHES
jgi:taurine dioxygenase